MYIKMQDLDAVINVSHINYSYITQNPEDPRRLTIAFGENDNSDEIIAYFMEKKNQKVSGVVVFNDDDMLLHTYTEEFSIEGLAEGFSDENGRRIELNLIN